MPYIDYETTSLHSSSVEISVHYHVRRALLGMSPRQKEPHQEIIDACLEGPLCGAIAAIREWSQVWAPKVAPGFDPEKGPEIALNLEVTTRGNLDVTWMVIMTQDQYNEAPSDFRDWIRQIDHQPIAQRRDNQLYFIRHFDMLQWQLDEQRAASDVLELSRISAVALAVMMAELPGKLAPMVQAHWQHVLDFRFLEKGGATPASPGITVHDMWTHSRTKAWERERVCLEAIRIDAHRLGEEWARVAQTHPRVRSDAGRSKAVAAALGVRPDQVDAARSAVATAAQWHTAKPRLWWNRADPYPPWWGGYR